MSVSSCLELCSRLRKLNTKGKICRLILVSSFLLMIMMPLINDAKAASLKRRNSSRSVTIISKDGKYLTITDRKIKGEDSSSSYSKLKLSSVGLNGEVTIQGVKAKRFLVMTSAGQVYLTKTVVNDAVFIDGYVNGNVPFRSFRSKSNARNYLAISTTGMVTNSTTQDSPDVQFAVFSH